MWYEYTCNCSIVYSKYIPRAQMTLVLVWKDRVLGAPTFKNTSHLGSRLVYVQYMSTSWAPNELGQDLAVETLSHSRGCWCFAKSSTIKSTFRVLISTWCLLCHHNCPFFALNVARKKKNLQEKGHTPFHHPFWTPCPTPTFTNGENTDRPSGGAPGDPGSQVGTRGVVATEVEIVQESTCQNRHQIAPQLNRSGARSGCHLKPDKWVLPNKLVSWK